jgi:hypothetical protein
VGQERGKTFALDRGKIGFRPYNCFHFESSPLVALK